MNSPPLNIAQIPRTERPGRDVLRAAADWFRKYGSNGYGVAAIERNLQYEKLLWVKVKSIEHGFSHVVDFCIEGDSSFITSGIVSHNTPFCAQDLYSELSQNKQYHYASFPAIDEKTGRALWPELFSYEYLQKRKGEIGPVRFARELMCVPISDDMSLFPSTLFRGTPVEQPMATLGQPLQWWRERGIESIYMGVDIALSSSAGADYTVIWVVGLDKARNRWILDIYRDKGLPYQVQKSIIHEYGRKYAADLVMIEANQAQRIFGDELIRESDLPIKKYETGVEKHSLEKGIPSMRILLENGKYRIPRGDARSIELTDTWINEMRAWAFDKGKVVSVAAHDDVAMASWICEQGIRMGAFGFSFDSKEDVDALGTELDREGVPAIAATASNVVRFPRKPKPVEDDDGPATSPLFDEEEERAQGMHWQPPIGTYGKY